MFEEPEDDVVEDDVLEHIGIKRRSGRYPWGSGKDAYQRSKDFKAYYQKMKDDGLTDAQIAEGIGMHLKKQGVQDSFKTPDLRAAIAISTEEIRAANTARAQHLKNEVGMSASAIAKEMLGDSRKESTVRGWLAASEARKVDALRSTADALKEQLKTKEFLDVGKGQHLYMGVSFTRLNTALAMLRDEGYALHTNIRLPQAGTDQFTTYKVLAKEGVTWAQARLAVVEGRLRTIGAQSDDNGVTYKSPKEGPVSISSKRVAVNYKEDGGHQMDGVIELRRGVEDLSLGANKYAQVRIAVDGTHYLKGMAMYADDMPKGVDVRFNTNKSKADPNIKSDLDAMKPMKADKNGKVDPANPFGATTYPKLYTDKSGKEKTSALAMVNEEGRWDEWSKSLSSQMLSKQSVSLATTQLGKARAAKEQDLKTIMALTNPVVKHKLLLEFSETADSAAVHLKAAALDRQSTHVILPIKSIRPHEIYAPNFTPGEKVVLVRHPHGGPFEIPELTVNNRNPLAKRILGGAKDAVGIHHSVAEQLSGADFDGDTVLVIPNDSRKVKRQDPLTDLKGFDPKTAYPKYDGMPVMSKKNTQTEMGKISNLITDMTIHNANKNEIARAVRHSMVVIDAEKHELNYKQSEKDHGIKELKTLYQGGPNKGANTIISKASSEARVPKRKEITGPKGIDPKTGEKLYRQIDESTTRVIPRTSKRTGITTLKTVVEAKTTKGTKMEFAKDARELLSSNAGAMEHTYANHANSMKALANQARKATLSIEMPKHSPAAKAHYLPEVESLNAKLKIAQRNAPLERRAQSIAHATSQAKIDAHPEFDKDDIKKARYQSLEDARLLTGANKKKIGADGVPEMDITPREWEAIQSRAVSASHLREILANANMDRIKELATPRARTSLTPGQMARAKSMEASGKSLAQISEQLGIPRSTISDNLKR